MNFGAVGKVPKIGLATQAHLRQLPKLEPLNRLGDQLLVHLMNFNPCTEAGKKRNRQFATQVLAKLS